MKALKSILDRKLTKFTNKATGKSSNIEVKREHLSRKTQLKKVKYALVFMEHAGLEISLS